MPTISSFALAGDALPLLPCPDYSTFARKTVSENEFSAREQPENWCYFFLVACTPATESAQETLHLLAQLKAELVRRAALGKQLSPCLTHLLCSCQRKKRSVFLNTHEIDLQFAPPSKIPSFHTPILSPNACVKDSVDVSVRSSAPTAAATPGLHLQHHLGENWCFKVGFARANILS